MTKQEKQAIEELIAAWHSLHDETSAGDDLSILTSIAKHGFDPDAMKAFVIHISGILQTEMAKAPEDAYAGINMATRSQVHVSVGLTYGIMLGVELMTARARSYANNAEVPQ